MRANGPDGEIYSLIVAATSSDPTVSARSRGIMTKAALAELIASSFSLSVR
jgi:hypothetical protein